MIEKICYAGIFLAEAVIAWLYFESLYIPKKRIWVQILTFILGYAFLFGIFLLNNIALNATLGCIINAILARLNYGSSVKSSLLHGIFLEFALVGTELFTNLLIVSAGYDFAAYTYNVSVLIAMAIVSKLLYLAVAMVGARLFKPRKNPVDAPRLTTLFSCLPAFSIIMAVLIIYLGLSSEMTFAAGIMMVFTIFALLIVNLIFMVVYKYWQKANDEQLSLQLSLQKEQADTAYYQAMQEQFENQRILIHDIKNHLHTIDTLCEGGQIEQIRAYVSDLSVNLTTSTQAKLCTNPILNMLLLRCANDCKAQNIQFLCDVRDNTTDFMDSPSITTLYGNLLSNALEAAAASEMRQIEISVKYSPEQRIILVSVVNSCDSIADADDDGYYHSTKTDGEFHGIGLKSIRRVVKKYRGVSSMYYDKENRQFHHIIQFPVTN